MAKSKKEWEIWEEDFCSMAAATKVRLSGRLPLFKGDAKDDFILADCKYTADKVYSVTESVWSKLNDWARNEGRDPVLAIRTSECEIAVVSSMFLNELGRSASDWKLKPQKSFTVGLRTATPQAHCFRLGRYKLAAYAMSDFLNDLAKYEREREDESRKE